MVYTIFEVLIRKMSPIVLLSFICLCCQMNRSSDFNFDIEQPQDSYYDFEGWTSCGINDDYVISLDSTTVHSGKYALRLEPDTTQPVDGFGCIYHHIPAEYQGKIIKLTGYMKMDNVYDGHAGISLQINGKGETLLQENLEDQNLQGTSDWLQYSIEEFLPEDADEIYIGAYITGNGKIWIDDFELQIDNENITDIPLKDEKTKREDAAARVEFNPDITIDSLTIRDIGNLAILGKIWGFMKYYHPSISQGLYKWDYELFHIMPDIIDAETVNERNIVLNSWIDKYRIREFSTEEVVNESRNVKQYPDLQWISDKYEFNKVISMQLNQIMNADRPKSNYYVGLVPGVGNPKFKNEDSYEDMKYPDVEFRILCLYRYWNIIEYFFPYKYAIGKDWDEVLYEFIPKFVNAENERDYKVVVLELLASINDTHATIWPQDSALLSYFGTNYAPLRISFINKQPVIIGYLNDFLGSRTNLKKGDIIRNINGEPVSSIVNRRLPITSGSNLPAKLNKIGRNLLRTNDSTLTLSYQSDGLIDTIKVDCFPPDRLDMNISKDKRAYKFLTKDIGYIYLGNIESDEIPTIMSKFHETSGIVIDMRCYPSDFVVFSLGEQFMAEPTDFAKFTVCDIQQPGLFSFTQRISVGKANPNYYKGEIILLVNESTISQTEYTAMAFQAASKVRVVGSTTAGADGNFSAFSLPGGINTGISGIGVYYPDGSETQRIGILPDIEISPSVDGIRAERDELLERAVDLLEENNTRE